MDDKRKLALELATALIQNSNVKPVFSHTRKSDIGDENSIAYLLGDSKYSFTDLVSHFLDSIERIEKWESH